VGSASTPTFVRAGLPAQYAIAAFAVLDRGERLRPPSSPTTSLADA